MMRGYVLLACVWLLSACTQPVKEVHETRFMMGTLVSFVVSDVVQSDAEAAIRAAADEMQRVEDAFTIYGDADNDVKRFNRTPAHQKIVLNDEVAHVLEVALDVAQKSSGAFSPTLGALNLLWGFSQTPMPTQPPQDAAIQRIRMALPDCVHHAEGKWWRDTAACQLDFGGIAKGYAIDRGIETLRHHGVRDAMIDAGGDLRVIGQHHGKPWRIGIRHPRKPAVILGVLALQGDQSVVTSGDYERFFIANGRRYHHILDAHTGYPSASSQSVTVWAQTAMQADAWSTALFVLGTSGLSQVSSLGIQALQVDALGKTHATAGFRMLVP